MYINCHSGGRGGVDPIYHGCCDSWNLEMYPLKLVRNNYSLEV